MFLEPIEGKLPSQRIKIRYDCDGGNDRCGKECDVLLKVAEKNFGDNGGKHICRSCQLKAKNPMYVETTKEKVKQTNLEKYGATCALNSEENIKKRVEQMFGTEKAVQEIVAKRKKTSQERYGADHIMKTDEGKRRVRQTFRSKYDTDAPLQNPAIMAKMKQTNLERYGVENVGQVPEVRIKMAQTTLERYGVKHYNQLPEMKDYLREHCKEWLAESYAAGGPAKGIIRPEAWNQKQSLTMAEKLLRGELNPEDKRFFVTGYYKSTKCKKPMAFFRSSLELMMHWILDHDKQVVWYENEPFAIRYEKETGQFRHYIPDFFVFRKDGKPRLVEIKPAFKMREKEVAIKVRAGNTYAEEHGMDFAYVDEKYLRANSPKLADLQLMDNVQMINK